LSVIARQQGRELAAVAREAEAELLAGSSLKAALDLNWDDPAERGEALGMVLSTLEAVERFLAQGPVGSDQPVVSESLAIAHQVRDQDVEVLPENVIQLRHGVAKERRISVEDGQMRHGRKSRSQRVDGYKRHILRDLDNKLVRVVGLTPANVPEAAVTDALEEDLAAQGAQLSELHIDRAYLSSRLVRERSDELAIYCKAWPVRNGDRFPKTAFALDFEQGSIRCPNQVSIPFQVGTVVHFPEEHCAVCPLQLQCTSSPHGRSVSIHPDEPLLAELRQRQQTTAGRAKLRERVAVEHGLAHVGHWQGDRARYRGLRKNLFDLRRVAVVHNLHVLARLMAGQQAVAA
jgi:IS5 family transposase